MIFLILDFETLDKYLSKDIDLGAGYPFAINYPEASLFYPLGASFCYYDTEDGSISKSEYLKLGGNLIVPNSIQDSQSDTPAFRQLVDLVKNAENIVCHNAPYDLGCLLSLGIKINHLKVYDTMIIAKLFDSNHYSYSLSNLLSNYQLAEKMTGSLIDVVKRHNLLKTPKGNFVRQDTKTYDKKAKDFAYGNMNLIQELAPDDMAFYANHDTQGCARLMKLMYGKVGDKLSAFYSNIQKIVTLNRAKGIACSIKNADNAIAIIEPARDKLQDWLRNQLGDINLNSPIQLCQVLIEKGYSLPLTEYGNPSVNKEFIEENPNDELIQTIGEYRTVNKLLNDFCLKIKNMQEYSCPYVIAGADMGRCFPEMNLLEARTGRFSSSNPNIQNIPKRNKEYAKLCRAIFTTDNPDNQWYSLDWSNQEGRLQLHYAYKTGCSGSKSWRRRFIENPALDVHRIVGEMMYKVPYPEGMPDEEIEDWARLYRTPAKTIYLGKSFCMGRAKTAKRLGLPTEYITIDTPDGPKKMLSSGPEATKLIEAYEEAFPYLSQLQKDCTKTIIRLSHC